MNKATDIEAQYDKIYRYCFFRLHSRELAEDITQETFLRFLESTRYRDRGKTLHYLYTIARNLCIDQYRNAAGCEIPAGGARIDVEAVGGGIGNGGIPSGGMPGGEERWVETLAVREALAKLEVEEQELLLLRYANMVPIKELCGFFGASRFAIYRRIRTALAHLREELGEEDFG